MSAISSGTCEKRNGINASVGISVQLDWFTATYWPTGQSTQSSPDAMVPCGHCRHCPETPEIEFWCPGRLQSTHSPVAELVPSSAVSQGRQPAVLHPDPVTPSQVWSQGELSGSDTPSWKNQGAGQAVQARSALLASVLQRSGPQGSQASEGTLGR